MNKNKEPNKKYEDGGKEEERENMTNEPSLLGDINFPGCKGGKKEEKQQKVKQDGRGESMSKVSEVLLGCVMKNLFACAVLALTQFLPPKEKQGNEKIFCVRIGKGEKRRRGKR